MLHTSLMLRSIINSTRTINFQISRLFSSIQNTKVDSESAVVHSDSTLILSLTLPSRQETCRFHLNLQASTIEQLIDEIKAEDAGIEHVHIHDAHGHTLAKSCTLRALIKSPFTIQLNKQRAFLFDPVKNLQVKETISRQVINDSPSMEETVAGLWHALNMMKVYHSKYTVLKNEASKLTSQLEPLEKVKDKLADISQRYVSRCIWLGLAGMSFQVGLLAELTWDVYSWDIVEPMSYFIAFGTAMSFYAFYIMTRADFEMLTMTDRLFLRKFYREAQHHSFDIPLYNRLKDRLFAVHTDLARLHAPLVLSLPAPPPSARCKLTDDELNSLDFYRTRLTLN